MDRKATGLRREDFDVGARTAGSLPPKAKTPSRRRLRGGVKSSKSLSMITPRAVRAGSVVPRAALFVVVAFVISACSSSGSGGTGSTGDDGTDEGGGSYAGSGSGPVPTTAGRALQEADGSCP